MSEQSETAVKPPEPLDPVEPVEPVSGGRHPVHVAHLVMGVAFLGLAVIALLVQGDVVDSHDLRWLLPVPWIAGGAAGLAASALRAVRPAPRAAPGRGGR